MASSLVLRVRGPGGQSTLSLPASATVAEVVTAVAERTGVPLARLELRSGFPLRVLDFRVAPEGSPAATALGLSSGDSLQASEAAEPAQAVEADEPAPGPDAVLLADGSGFAVQRRIMASDNSCLFRAVAYLFNQDRAAGGALRAVVAAAVLADPEQFCEAVLGKPPAEYAEWIKRDDSWGGAIELAILSAHYTTELCGADIQTKASNGTSCNKVQRANASLLHQRVDRYGQGSFARRGYLLYDGTQARFVSGKALALRQGSTARPFFLSGIHYDAIAVAAFPGAPEELDVTLLEVDAPNADAVDQAVAGLVANAHSAHKFTDTAGFTLRCIVCREGMKGQAAAAEHAKRTGHVAFGEYH